MSKFAVVVILPAPEDDATRMDFQSREFDTWTEFAAFMEGMDVEIPGWRLVSVCHVEDLPMLMEGPPSGRPKSP